MTEEQRITKAKIGLVIEEPWFGQLACYLNLKETKTVPTAAINERGDFFFNPDFIKTLSDPELKGLVCHEILHLAFQHPFRMTTRNLILWNIAADLKINDELRNHRTAKLPKGGLIPDYDGFSMDGVHIKDIPNKTTELIYADLHKQCPPQVANISVSLGSGDGKSQGDVDLKDVKGPWKDLIKGMVRDLIKGAKDEEKMTEADMKRLKKDWEERIDGANQMHKGDIPAGLKRELDELEYPQLPWYQIIRQRLARLAFRKTWAQPNKKWLPNFFPGRVKNKSLKAVISIDTSGSMSRHDVTKALSETVGIANAFTHFVFHIIFNDCDVWDIIEVKSTNREKLKRIVPLGGGGTDFRPVFDKIKKEFNNQIDCLVFFTDGYGDFPAHQPPYQVYWVTENPTEVDWPFGKVISLKSTR